MRGRLKLPSVGGVTKTMSGVDVSLFRHAYLDPKVALYTLILSKRTRAILQEMTHDPCFGGSTDPSALSFLATYARLQQPARVLELGTHIGFSTLVVADVLAGNPRPGRLMTVDPAQDGMTRAAAYVRRARLESTVTFVLGRSTDSQVVDTLKDNGPFEMIYVDSSHSYRETLQELEILWGSAEIAGEGTCVWFHDAGRAAVTYDARGEGGVRRALDEWVSGHQGCYQLMVLEPPLWPNPTGLGVMRRGEVPSGPCGAGPG
jgi:predicted O-methyltransferase YrrM